jgi:transcriptional regulator with XRE-family HTH domain
MGDLNKAFGRRLRELRESALLTQKQLGDRARMADRYIGAIERGERNITLHNVERIREALGVEPGKLFSIDLIKPVSDEGVDGKILSNLLSRCDKATRTLVLNLVKQIVRLSQHQRKG